MSIKNAEKYIELMNLVADSPYVKKDDRPLFYEVYAGIKDSDELTQYESNRLHGIGLGVYQGEYMYSEAEKVANFLCQEEDLPWQAYVNLAKYYTTTRRYDTSDKLIEKALNEFSNNEEAAVAIRKCGEENSKKWENAKTGGKEYLPAPKENKEDIIQKYIDFMASIGIEVVIPSSNKPKKIPKDEYPEPVEAIDANFDTFVAFDLETTGRSSSRDSITEIGAIKVVGGEIVESAEFVFQEFVKPIDHKKLSDEIINLTGITNEDIQNARPIYEVLPDFMKFAGDAVLVGYNCMAFDSRFMMRAGRYSNIVIENRYFDVMKYAVRMKKEVGITKKTTLGEIANIFEIVNPHAHRALADAITTAKVFLKLKSLDVSGSGR